MMLFNGRLNATQTMEGIPAPGSLRDAPQPQQQQRARRKRKADSQEQNNERLSKRLSLLNLEHNGPKLYVPVENPQVPLMSPLSSSFSSQQQSPPTVPPFVENDTMMQLDDSKHKVYIYNLDDELTSSESEAEDGGKLIFLPDIEKHLRENRMPLPRSMFPNKDGELAGMQMVLYNVPSSITVPEEQDSVRKAIIETRARVRQRQQEERETMAAVLSRPGAPPMPPAMLPTIPEMPIREAHAEQLAEAYDPDAMDID